MKARTYKYRLYPTARQIETLSAFQSACYEVQKLCIQQRRIASSRKRVLGHGTLPTWASQVRELTELCVEYPELRAVPNAMLHAMVKRVDLAYKRAYADTKKTGKYIKVRWADKPSHIGLQFRGESYGTHLMPRTGVAPPTVFKTVASAISPLRQRRKRYFSPSILPVEPVRIPVSPNRSQRYYTIILPHLTPLRQICYSAGVAFYPSSLPCNLSPGYSFLSFLLPHPRKRADCYRRAFSFAPLNKSKLTIDKTAMV